jgi:DNA-binding MarR family transcriptional regulator
MSNNYPPSFYEAGHYRPEQSVGYLMNQVLSSIIAQADAQLATYKLTYVQWVPLFKLWMSEGISSASLARDISIDPAALTRSLNRLEIKGLIRRERSTQDRRVVHLSLTDAGREVVQHVPGVLVNVLNGHLQGFSAEEWAMLLQLLQRMLRNGDAMKQLSKSTTSTPTAPPNSN